MDNDGLAYGEESSNSNKWQKNGFGANVPKHAGKFTRAESDIVKRAVEEYCHAKQIPVSRLCAECEHKTDLKGAWMEIAKCLPHRSVQSVYRHGIRQLHPFKRGAWSEQEVQHLAELVQRLGKKWSTIQAKLNRSADSCRDKYREMSDDYVKGRWKVHETEQLERLIREHLSADPSMDMKDLGKYVEEEGITIPWSSISKRMGTRSRLSCFKRWQKLSGTGQMEDDDDDDDVDPQQPPAKRLKTTDYHAVHAAMASQDYDTYSAKIAAETVEAVELPDTEALMENVRDI